ncbi:Inosine/uridine-preferring nucleoside hydrolase domain-containing protein [Tuber brumale]|nr:Inosine/uridine-preferring nucleoside hydrolase domain-containing protein [Tuber brumale]
MTATKTHIWLDCDPGHDDAFAMILAAEHPNLELIGISTVHGNSSMVNVTTNALSLLTAIGKTDVPVYAGSRKPFMRPAVHAPDIHGDSGIDGTTLLPESKVAVKSGNTILAMYEAIMKTPFQTCAVVATGTLTNVALLFAAFPDVVGHIRCVSIMGGAFGGRADARGNITKWAEFNIYCDPESAQSIFSNPELSGRITLVPLDLTHTVLATSDVLATLMTTSHPTTKLRKMLHDLLTFFSKTYADVFNITAGPPLHDPLAVAATIPGNEIEWDMEEVQVEVVCHGEQIGQTIKTPRDQGEELGKGGAKPVAWVKVPRSVTVDSFWKVMMSCVEKADGRYNWE